MVASRSTQEESHFARNYLCESRSHRFRNGRNSKRQQRYPTTKKSSCNYKFYESSKQMKQSERRIIWTKIRWKGSWIIRNNHCCCCCKGSYGWRWSAIDRFCTLRAGSRASVGRSEQVGRDWTRHRIDATRPSCRTKVSYSLIRLAPDWAVNSYKQLEKTAKKTAINSLKPEFNNLVRALLALLRTHQSYSIYSSPIYDLKYFIIIIIIFSYF